MSARSAALSLLAAGWALHAPPAAACDPVIVREPAAIRIAYDPFAFSTPPATMAFELENRDDGACEIDVALVVRGRPAATVLDVGDTGVVLEPRAAGEAALLSTGVPGVWRAVLGGRAKLSTALELPITKDAVTTAGTHELALVLELRQRGGPLVLASVPVSFALMSPAKAQMNISGANGSYGSGPTISSVDFGTLETGKTRRVYLQVRANADTRLSITSEHDGRLVPSSEAVAGEDEPGVPYHARIDDMDVDLGTAVVRTLSPPRTPQGMSIPLDLVIGDAGAHRAGSYSDTLTIEASPL